MAGRNMLEQQTADVFDEAKYKWALNKIHQLGPARQVALVKALGSAKNIFCADQKKLFI